MNARRNSGLVVVVTSLLLAVPSAAQDRPVLEEIVVTAQKTEESILDVPASVSAIGSEQLEALGATGTLDYLFRTPSVSFETTGSEGRANRDRISIRGVNTTGYYFGESALPPGVNPRLVDIERVEILRGPQGTLYGSSSMAGLVKVLPVKPSSQAFASTLELGLGTLRDTDDVGYSVSTAFNFPLVADNAALRVVGYYSQEPGFIDTVYGEPLDYAPEIPTASLQKGVRHDLNEARVYGGRASLLWEPLEDLSLTTTVLWQRISEDGATDSDFNGQTRGMRFRSFDIEEPFSERDVVAQLEVEYELGGVTLTSATSWFNRKYGEDEDDTEAIDEIFRSSYANPLAAPFVSIITNDRDQTFRQQELRGAFSSGRWSGIVGLYYQKSEQSRLANWVMPGWSIHPDYALGLGDVLWFSDDSTSAMEQAAFASVTYAFSDRLDFSAGFRYAETETSFFFPTFGVFASNTIEDRQQSETNTTPRFAVNYRMGEGATLYASAAKGFRKGGPQLALADQCVEEAIELGLDPNATGFDSDLTWNYEVGAKAEFDNQASLRVGAYMVDWTDLQQVVRLQCAFSRTVNTGEASVQGVEAEVSFQPARGTLLGASLSYIDSQIDDPGLGAFAEKGDRVQDIPEWTASAFVEYGFSVGTRSAYARANFQYLGSSFSTFNQTSPDDPSELQPYRRREPFRQLDLRLGVDLTDNLQIALYGENITDEKANFGNVASIGIERSDRVRYITNRPQEVGLELRVSFD